MNLLAHQAALMTDGGPSGTWLEMTQAAGAFYIAFGDVVSGGTVKDSSGNGRHHAVPSFTSLPTDGPHGGPCLRFGAMIGASYVTSTGRNDFGMKGPKWSIEVWLWQPAALNRWVDWMGGAYDDGWSVKRNGVGTGRLGLDIKFTSGEFLRTTESQAVGQWTQMAYTYEEIGGANSGVYKRYADGVLIGTHTGLGRVVGPGIFRYGGSDGAYVSPAVNSRIARVALYEDVVLSPVEIAARFAAAA